MPEGLACICRLCLVGLQAENWSTTARRLMICKHTKSRNLDLDFISETDIFKLIQEIEPLSLFSSSYEQTGNRLLLETQRDIVWGELFRIFDGFVRQAHQELVDEPCVLVQNSIMESRISLCVDAVQVHSRACDQIS
jgi:hypothetical protein